MPASGGDSRYGRTAGVPRFPTAPPSIDVLAPPETQPGAVREERHAKLRGLDCCDAARHAQAHALRARLVRASDHKSDQNECEPPTIFSRLLLPTLNVRESRSCRRNFTFNAESIESSVKQKESHQAELVWPSGRGRTQIYLKAKGALRGHPRPGRLPHRHAQRRPASWQPPRHPVPRC